jgi:hypothetical protein
MMINIYATQLVRFLEQINRYFFDNKHEENFRQTNQDIMK